MFPLIFVCCYTFFAFSSVSCLGLKSFLPTIMALTDREHLDYFGIAATAYLLLFTTYMDIVKVGLN